MSSESINNNMQEYQALDSKLPLHNLCVKLDIPCLSFVQLNRDGITKESTDAVSGLTVYGCVHLSPSLRLNSRRTGRGWA